MSETIPKSNRRNGAAGSADDIPWEFEYADDCGCVTGSRGTSLRSPVNLQRNLASLLQAVCLSDPID